MTASTTAPGPGAGTLDGIVQWLEERPTLSRFVAAARRLDNLAQSSPGRFTDQRIAFVRNFTIEPIEPLLKIAAFRQGLRVSVSYSGYDLADEAALSALLDDRPDVVFVLLRLEDLAPALTRDFLETGADRIEELAEAAVARVVDLVREIRSRSDAVVVVHNFTIPLSPPGGLADAQDPRGQVNTVRSMNLALAKGISGLPGALLLDFDHVLASVGLRTSLDDRGERTAGAPFSLSALRALSEAQARCLHALGGATAKCVIVDCDNTLWGGIVGEDGLAGLLMGETGGGWRHNQLQKSLRILRHRGIVLALCSKNDKADVQSVLRSHPECLVSESDFVAMRVNWDDKVDNITAIAQELNLGLGHIIFLDDNPFECELVRYSLPEVHVLKWPEDLGDNALHELTLFDAVSVTDEDRARTAMYQAETKRQSVRREATSNEDYLRSLSMVATVGRCRPEHLARVAQLIQRTNQFNLTTRRHDLAELERMIKEPCAAVLWLHLEDRFGPQGVVGCGIVTVDDAAAVIDTLLLSCRVLGRGVERALVNRLADAASKLGAEVLVGRYIPSGRNDQVADLYTRLGFDGPEDLDGAATWRWPLRAGLPEGPEWVDIVDADGASDE